MFSWQNCIHIINKFLYNNMEEKLFTLAQLRAAFVAGTTFGENTIHNEVCADYDEPEKEREAVDFGDYVKQTYDITV